MAKPFKRLTDRMSPERRARVEARVQETIREMALTELRTARDLTQVHLATLLGMKQPAVSKLERRTDMYISTLRQVVEAMGGALEIRAVFPEGEVRITQFQTLAEQPDEAVHEPASVS